MKPTAKQHVSDLVSEEELSGIAFPRAKCDDINQRHRERLSTQIHLRNEMEHYRDQWRARAEKAETELAALRSQPADSREAFEKESGISFHARSWDGYSNVIIDARWLTWQAAVQWSRQQSEKGAGVWRLLEPNEPRQHGDEVCGLFGKWEGIALATIGQSCGSDLIRRRIHREQPALPTPPAAPDLPPNEQAAFEDWLSKTSPSGDCESVRQQWHDSSDYRDLQAPMSCITFTNGKIDPPPHGQWHRQDWTPEMLAGGWRPLLLGETGEGEIFIEGAWLPIAVVDRDTPAVRGAAYQRARRPLPPAPAPEPEPEPEWVPLGPEDVPPGSAVKRTDDSSWSMVVVCMKGTIEAAHSGGTFPLTLKEMFYDEWLILRPGQPEWQPCKKLKK